MLTHSKITIFKVILLSFVKNLLFLFLPNKVKNKFIVLKNTHYQYPFSPNMNLVIVLKEGCIHLPMETNKALSSVIAFPTKKLWDQLRPNWVQDYLWFCLRIEVKDFCKFSSHVGLSSVNESDETAIRFEVHEKSFSELTPEEQRAKELGWITNSLNGKKDEIAALLEERGFLRYELDANKSELHFTNDHQDKVTIERGWSRERDWRDGDPFWILHIAPNPQSDNPIDIDGITKDLEPFMGFGKRDI